MKPESFIRGLDKGWRLLGLILMIPFFIIAGIVVAYGLLFDAIQNVLEEYK